MDFEGPARGFGKWSARGVPKKGWSCVGVEDLGAPDAICEMCEKQEIRYVHSMEHTNYPDTLKCGCVCAGHMEEDLVRARERDKSIKGRTRNRKRWLTRKWKTTSSGNPMIDSDGFRVVIFRKPDGWSGFLIDAATDQNIWARKHHPSEDAAKLAAFDMITLLLFKSGRLTAKQL